MQRFMNTPCGTRARKLRIRSPTPCPLGQGGLFTPRAEYPNQLKIRDNIPPPGRETGARAWAEYPKQQDCSGFRRTIFAFCRSGRSYSPRRPRPIEAATLALNRKMPLVPPFVVPADDTLAEWLRRRPAKPMGSPRVGSNPTGVVCFH